MMVEKRTETVKDCHYPWTWMHVAADGSVKPCCFARGELGNLFNEPDADAIWNGPIAVELRAFIKRNEVHPVCRGAICKFVQNMEKAEAFRIWF
jgi:MoaA/NifB/PqqE/SkfB family radical SAM enzyme